MSKKYLLNFIETKYKASAIRRKRFATYCYDYIQTLFTTEKLREINPEQLEKHIEAFKRRYRDL